MHWSRIVGIALIAVGAILLYFGYEASQSITEEALRKVSGSYSDETTYYFIGGGGAAVLGLLLALFGVRSR